ncbi:unnamed protein product, partial [Musa hybrid cultivar]
AFRLARIDVASSPLRLPPGGNPSPSSPPLPLIASTSRSDQASPRQRLRFDPRVKHPSQACSQFCFLQSAVEECAERNRVLAGGTNVGNTSLHSDSSNRIRKGEYSASIFLDSRNSMLQNSHTVLLG